MSGEGDVSHSQILLVNREDSCCGFNRKDSCCGFNREDSCCGFNRGDFWCGSGRRCLASNTLTFEACGEDQKICHELGLVEFTAQEAQDAFLKVKLKDRWRRTKAKLTVALADLVASPGRHHLSFTKLKGGVTHGSVVLDVRRLGVDMEEKEEVNNIPQ